MTDAERVLVASVAPGRCRSPDMIPPGPRAIDKARLKALSELVAAILAENVG